jgi:hypothetical protein
MQQIPRCARNDKVYGCSRFLAALGMTRFTDAAGSSLRSE